MRIMSASPESRPRKRPVNLSLDGDLVDRARAITGNLSAEVESLLTDFVQRGEAERAAEIQRLRDSTAEWNAFAERHDSFADEFSTL